MQDNSFLQSTTAKLMMIGFLAIVLLLPLEWVKNLIYERAQREQEVKQEITEKWGRDITFFGPILKVPYQVASEIKLINQKTNEVIKEQKIEISYAYFFPDQLINHSEIQTNKKKRSNFEAVIFNSKLDFKGSFSKPNFAQKNIKDSDVLWDKATIVIKTTDLKNIKSEPKIKINAQTLNMESVFAESKDGLQTLESVSTQNLFENSETMTFDFTFNFDGSERIQFIPIGKTTEVTMNSNWDSPSFNGYVLPLKSKITPKQGFEAQWRVLNINRPFPQHYFGNLPHLDSYALAVDFMIPVDEYQKNERASKYGFLIIGLTFLIFFLIQTMSKINIHIFQYSMIGIALTLFYTLLISITEHSSFLLAYMVASIAVVVMISLYAISILKGRKFPLFIGISLSFLYAFIFVIIQLENYALLVGSIGLFLILGAVMYFSRNIEWYKTQPTISENDLRFQ